MKILALIGAVYVIREVRRHNRFWRSARLW